MTNPANNHPLDRIEDLFEPVTPTNAPTSTTPLDDAVMTYGFDEVYRALQDIADQQDPA